MAQTQPPAVLIAYQIAVKEITNENNDKSKEDRIIMCKTFVTTKIIGSFFSCIYKERLRLHVVFNEETTMFNDEIAELINQSMVNAGVDNGAIWVRAANQSIITYLDGTFNLTSDSEQFFYHSTEYIMYQNQFNKTYDKNAFDVKPYEEKHIDKYLELLNDSMSFFIPPQDFADEKEKYLKEFSELRGKNAFEAFWKGGILVGLYWINGTEVDTMGVSSEYQRLGYGSMILTRAIENVFLQNPDAEYAVLYAVGWNAKAQNFYRKYGMKVNAEHKVPYVESVC